MIRKLLVLLIVFGMSAVAAAQTQPPLTALPPDIARLPEAIRTLPWQSIDLSTVSPLEYDRALLLMNHALDQIAPVRASEADLMSAYIQAQNLGAEFAKTPQPPTGIPLTYTEATKVAVALLRGPMANSSYASQLDGTSEQGLAAYRQMYDSTCQRRWGEVTESVQQARWMGTFLQSKGKMPDYEAWAKLESENRQLKYQLAMEQQKTEQQAAARQAAEARATEAQLEKLKQENMQLQQALAAAQAQQQQQVTQQANQVQQQASQAQQQGAAYSAPYYTGYGVPAYYGTGAAWCYDTAYANEARAQTEQRLSNYYGTPHPGGYAHPAVGRR